MTPIVVVIDNYDSFTYNLVQYFGILGAKVHTHYHDQITIEMIEQLDATHLCISPGPGQPENTGISLEVIDAFHTKLPILGVCLGHQCLIQYFGGIIMRGDPVHGKATSILHKNSPLFKNIPSPFQATRYHSLQGSKASLPSELCATAWTESQELMAIEHIALPLFGVQFHPESILTEEGITLLSNFLTFEAT